MAWLMTFADVLIWQKLQKQLYLSISFSLDHTSLPLADILKKVEMCLHGLFSNNILFYSSVWSIKLSFLLFFRTLGSKIRRQRLIWWSVLAFTIASYGVCIVLLDFRCMVGRNGIDLCNFIKPFRRWRAYTLIWPVKCTGHHHRVYEYSILRLTTSLDVITDALSEYHVSVQQTFWTKEVTSYSGFHKHPLESADWNTKKNCVNRNMFAHSVHYCCCHHSSRSCNRWPKLRPYMASFLGRNWSNGR